MHHLTATCGYTKRSVAERKVLPSILRPTFILGCNTLFSSVRVDLKHHFIHSPSPLTKHSEIYSSVNGKDPLQDIYDSEASKSNKIWRLLRCIYSHLLL